MLPYDKLLQKKYYNKRENPMFLNQMQLKENTWLRVDLINDLWRVTVYYQGNGISDADKLI